MARPLTKPVVLRPPRPGLYRCQGCGDPFQATQPAVACSQACTQRLYRKRLARKR